VDASRFSNHHRFKVHCKCGHVTQIELEKRGQYRKETDIAGSYRVFESQETPPDSGTMTVVDISRVGVRLKFSSFPKIHPGDMVNIKFNLDDKNRSFVNRDVIVKNIKAPYAGARFHRTHDMDNILGFYMFK
jgi:hypothetical protein